MFGYADRSGWTNSRGARAVELLKADSRITIEKAMAIANDIRPFGAPRWVEALLKADAKLSSARPDNRDYLAGIQELRSWNYELAADSRAALKYAYWRIQLAKDMGGGRVRNLAQRVDCLREPLG